MRKILILIAIILPLISSGQIQIGLQTGASFKNGIAAFASARAMKNNKASIIGLGIDFYRFSGVMDDIYYYNTSGERIVYKDNWSYIAINPNLYANYKFPLLKGYLYAGGTFGYYFAPMPAYAIKHVSGSQWGSGVEKWTENQHTVNYGAQIGYCLAVTKNLSINIEGAVRHTTLLKRGFTHFPVSAGLRYSL